MTTKPAVLLMAILLIPSGGCTTTDRSDSWRQGTTTVKVTGAPGTRITGFYLRDEQRQEFSGTLPFTLTQTGLSKLEIRKVDPNESITADVWYESPGRQLSAADALAGPGLPGIRIEFRHGFWVEHLRR